jgi:hypothetical protein
MPNDQTSEYFTADAIIALEIVLRILQYCCAGVWAASLQDILDLFKESLHTLQSFSSCLIIEVKSFKGFCCGEINNLLKDCESQFSSDSEIEERVDRSDSGVCHVDNIAVYEVVLMTLTLEQKKMAVKFLLGRCEQSCWTKGSFLQCFVTPKWCKICE